MEEDQEKQSATKKMMINPQGQKQLKLKIINSTTTDCSSSSASAGHERQQDRNGVVVDNGLDRIDLQGPVQQQQQQQQQEARICDVCGKSFSSGKALGGHKRFHNQEARKNGAGAGLVPPSSKTVKLKLLEKSKVVVDGDNDKKTRTATATTCPETRVACTVCPKVFPSMKSLFGHMRSHRDRQWRGIQPPPDMVLSDKPGSCSPAVAPMDNKLLRPAETKIQKVDEEDEYEEEEEDDEEDEDEDGDEDGDDEDDDDDEYEVGDQYDQVNQNGLGAIQSGDATVNVLPTTWSKTDKRGRGSFCRPDRAAAARLVSLSAGNQSPKFEDEEEEGSKKTLNYESDDDDAYWLRGEDHKKLELHGDNNQNWGFFDHFGTQKPKQHDSNHHGASGTTAAGCGKRKMTTTSTNTAKKLERHHFPEKKPRKASESSSSSSSSQGKGNMGVDDNVVVGGGKKPKTSFKCTSCGKSFGTFQALGGHRSSHNKDKSNNPSSGPNVVDAAGNLDSVNVSRGDEKPSAAAGDTRAAAAAFRADHEVQDYYCKICNEKFTTRRALGGHMKCHSRRPLPQVADDHHRQAPMLAPNTSEAASPGEASNQSLGENSQSSAGARPMFDIDLNEPYVHHE